MWYWQEMHAKAIEYLKLAVRENDNDGASHRELAFSYAHLRQWEDAERHFKRALKIDPNDSRAIQGYEKMKRARTKLHLK